MLDIRGVVFHSKECLPLLDYSWRDASKTCYYNFPLFKFSTATFLFSIKNTWCGGGRGDKEYTDEKTCTKFKKHTKIC